MSARALINISEKLVKCPTLEQSQTFTADTLNILTSTPPREICGELLRAGERAVLGSTSKSAKSWALLHLALCKAEGKPWLGWEMKKGNVLYIDLELIKWFFDKRVAQVCGAMNIPKPKTLTTWSIRKVRPKPTMEQLVKDTCRRFMEAELDLIIVEPSYKLVAPTSQGTNSEMEVMKYLELLDEMALELGCAVITSHHSPKGDLSKRGSMDLFSGTGVWARDPDLLMTLRPHKEPDHQILDFTRRHGPPVDGRVLKWEFPLHTDCPDLDPDDIRNPQDKGSENTSRLIEALATAPAGGFTSGEWLKASGLSDATYYRMKSKSMKSGKWVAVAGSDGRSRFKTKEAAEANGDLLGLTING